MRNSVAASGFTALLLSAGCAGLQGPPDDLMTRVPVVEIGKPEPADKHYVLYIPAGKPLPVRLTVTGPLVVKPGEATTSVQFNHRLYIYREWSSLDGINWTQHAFDGRVSFGLAAPGGIVEIHVNRAD